MRLSAVKLAVVALLCCTTATAKPAADAHWVASWSASPDSAGEPLRAQPLRQIVRLSIGGSSLRVRISNRYGSAPLTIGAAHVAAHASGSSIRADSDRALSFNGKPTLTLPAGAEALSDAVAFPTTALQELAVSLYLPQGAAAATLHALGRQTAFGTPGDATAAREFAMAATASARFFLADVEVATVTQARALAVIGDSITDGFASTPDRNARWPDALAARLQADAALAQIAVINAGISGNRLLREGPAGAGVLARFERDALDKPGVRWVLLQAGINDIGLSDEPETPADVVSAQQIIDGMQALIARAHARGVAIWGATLLPCEGSELCTSTAAEAKRQAVNAWMRSANAFDHVIDFEQAVRDPARPQRLLPALDSGDHLHPNDAGYAAMAAALDLHLFQASALPGPERKEHR